MLGFPKASALGMALSGDARGGSEGWFSARNRCWRCACNANMARITEWADLAMRRVREVPSAC
jgi:hypothetical protein